MIDEPTINALLFVIPAAVVWALVCIDIVATGNRSVRAKAVWLVAVTLFLPVALVWLLVRRPQQGPVPLADVPDTDPRVRLVAAVVRHDAGIIDTAEFEQIKQSLEPGP